ncbi:hypothetical protein T4A_11685 [Trichinella pseudospiralis]|uniref:Uncharacterized protein n=1 Tax=Trichinella pseudospiralis TaxID=6337 RepID=A0A0V1DRZ2_TRIPS|nr:hypothetical protein T4A_11685 [Trichinella pseudospiralis]
MIYEIELKQSIEWDRETSEFNDNREPTKRNVRKKRNVQNGMESADCLWSHYVQVQVLRRYFVENQNEIHALNFLAILEIKYTFFWFSKTYKQLIQVFAEVQHDLWVMLVLHFLSRYSFSSTVTSACYHPFADSCICAFNARLV